VNLSVTSSNLVKHADMMAAKPESLLQKSSSRNSYQQETPVATSIEESLRALARSRINSLSTELEDLGTLELRKGANSLREQLYLQTKLLEIVNESLLKHIENLEKLRSEKSSTEEQKILKKTIKHHKEQVLKNLAKSFSASLSASDNDLSSALLEKRIKGVYALILDLYRGNLPLDKTIDPFSLRDFNEINTEKEIHGTNLDPASLDARYAVGKRDKLIENLETHFNGTFREKSRLIRSYVEDNLMNRSKFNHKALMPDGTITSRQLGLLGFSNADLREQHVFPLGLNFSMGAINEQRASIAALLLNQLIESRNITNYLQNKVEQFKHSSVPFSSRNYEVNFEIKKILNFSSRGPFDISGADIGFIIETQGDKPKYYLALTQVKSSELAARKSMNEKYPDIQAVSAIKHKLNPKQRLHLSDRQPSAFVTGTESTYRANTLKERKRSVDPDLILKLINGINRDSNKAYREISEEQMKKLENLFNNKKLFYNSGKVLNPISDDAEIMLMQNLNKQGALSSLCLAYQKYPLMLHNQLLYHTPDKVPNANTVQSFTELIKNYSDRVKLKLNLDQSIQIPQSKQLDLYNLMVKHKIDIDFLKAAVYKIFREYEKNLDTDKGISNTENFRKIDLNKVLQEYKELSKSEKRILGDRLALVNKILINYLFEMLSKTNPQLSNEDKTDLIEILKLNKHSFSPFFFERISSTQIKTKEDIENCLNELPKNFRTPNHTGTIDLEKTQIAKLLKKQNP